MMLVLSISHRYSPSPPLPLPPLSPSPSSTPFANKHQKRYAKVMGERRVTALDLAFQKQVQMVIAHIQRVLNENQENLKQATIKELKPIEVSPHIVCLPLSPPLPLPLLPLPSSFSTTIRVHNNQEYAEQTIINESSLSSVLSHLFLPPFSSLSLSLSPPFTFIVSQISFSPTYSAFLIRSLVDSQICSLPFRSYFLRSPKMLPNLSTFPLRACIPQ